MLSKKIHVNPSKNDAYLNYPSKSMGLLATYKAKSLYSHNLVLMELGQQHISLYLCLATRVQNIFDLNLSQAW